MSKADGQVQVCRSHRTLLCAFPALLVGMLMPGGVRGQAVPADEVKAAYLQKFPGFVVWPANAFDDATAPIVVGVLGADTVSSELSKLAAGRLAQGRPLLVRRLVRLDPDEVVHLLFVGRGAPNGTLRAAVRAFGTRTLIVTDAAQGLEQGAAIAFVESDGKLRFEVSMPAAQQARLRLSARLLGVAARVVGTPT